MTREEAIEILRDIYQFLRTQYTHKYTQKEAIDMAMEALEKEPKPGEWIKHENPEGVFSRECSECKCWFQWDMPRNSFCPNCGAKMDKEEISND